MLKVVERQTTPTSRAKQPAGATYEVEWVDDRPAGLRHGTTRRRRADARPTTRRSRYVGEQGLSPRGRVILPARGRRLRQRHGLLHLDPGRRAAEPSGLRHHRPGGFGQRRGPDLGPTTSGASGCTCSTSRPDADVLDFPDNVTTSRAGHWSSARTTTNDNFVRGLTRKGDLLTSPERLCRPASADLRRRVRRALNDEFAGSTFSPDGRTLFVNIQASQRHDLRDLGSLGRHRRLSDGRADEAACRG